MVDVDRSRPFSPPVKTELSRYDLRELIGAPGYAPSVEQFPYGFYRRCYELLTAICGRSRPDYASRYLYHSRFTDAWHEIRSFYERPDIHQYVNGRSLPWVLGRVLGSLEPRQFYIIRLRYGLQLRSRKATLVQFERLLGISRSRVGQIEAQAMKRLKHRSSINLLKPFIRVRSRREENQALARLELYSYLVRGIEGNSSAVTELAYSIAMRTQRRLLARTLIAARNSDFKEVNKAVALGCTISAYSEFNCAMCDEPALPQIPWCLVHLSLKTKIVLVCGGCGVRFPRIGSLLIRNQPNFVFHDRPCMWANGKALGVWEHKVEVTQ